jgi:aminoglycoside 6-adenylyltransferase
VGEGGALPDGMDQSTSAYERLIERFVRWAQDQRDIRAAFVIGSRARADHPADQWSDLDIIVVATDPERYLSSAGWLENIGTPWITFLERTATDDEMERRVLFEGGLDVDFALTSQRTIRQLARVLWVQRRVPQLLRLLPAGSHRRIMQQVAVFRDIVRRGMGVLLDRDGIVAGLTPLTAEAPPLHPPTQDEFLQAVSDFWYHAVWTAKKLGRGEVWVAKSCCDAYMKWLLLQMIEWHAGAMNGWSYDTWHRGRFLERWADPRAVEGLRAAFAHYDADDVRRALLATMDLFGWLAMETAEQLGYPYPSPAEEHATEFVKDLFA